MTVNRLPHALRFKLAIMLFVMAAPLAFGGTFTAFGPQTYQRGRGAPVTASNTFSILNPSRQYSLHVTTDGVTSAIVWVNGTVVLRPSDFHKHGASIVRSVQLQVSNTVAVQLRGKPGSSLSLEIVGVDNDPPLIAATVTPIPNGNGWNRSNVTVSFTCSDATSGVAVCPAPVIVSREGGGQVLTGTAIDRAGNSASVSATVNLDKTPPAILILAPASGAIVSASTVAVSGTVNDALSGVEGVSCGDAKASVVGLTFSCTVDLNAGPNSLVVSASDVAGNSSSASTQVLAVVTLPPGSTLPSDSDCASRVRYSSFEPRLDNATANHTTGTTGVQIHGASSAFNSRFAGRINGSFTGTTDEILQWGACKWGWDADTLRAQAVQESNWHQSAQGDYTSDATACATIGLSAPCYQSYGILQIPGTLNPGTYPTSQQSTPFNVDYALAWERACFEGDFTWLGNGYQAGDIWGCLGAWFSGKWYNQGAQNYINLVKQHLVKKEWLQPDF